MLLPGNAGTGGTARPTVGADTLRRFPLGVNSTGAGETLSFDGVFSVSFPFPFEAEAWMSGLDAIRLRKVPQFLGVRLARILSGMSGRSGTGGISSFSLMLR